MRSRTIDESLLRHEVADLCRLGFLMITFVVLFLAAFTRLVPHSMHGIGLNFTAVGGGLLFFGARRARWQAGVAAAVMALTDVYLTCFVYGLPLHVSDYWITWAWYAGGCLMGAGLLRRITPLRVGLSVLCSATSFFVLSNFAVWLGSGMYPHHVAGFVDCYVAALPFYANDLASTGLTAGVLFGLPVVARHVVAACREASGQQEPLL